MTGHTWDERLSNVVDRATAIVAEQADCNVIDAFDRLQARADQMGQSLHDTALDVIDHVITFER